MKAKLNASWVAAALMAVVGLMSLPLPSAEAGFVTGPWINAVAQGNGPIHNPNTASPIVGDLVDDGSTNSNAADAEMLHSGFPSYTLIDDGDKIVLTGSVTIQGMVVSADSSATPRTQFRFGLFDNNGSANNTGWVGYYMSNKHGDPGTPAGTLARKPVGNTSVYLSATGQNSLASQQGSGGAGSRFQADTYSMLMTIERMGADVLLSSTLTGANGFLQSMSFTDTTASTLGTYTFDSVGFLLGGNLDADRAEFRDIHVAFIPEPASWLLGLGVLMGGVLARRRAG